METTQDDSESFFATARRGEVEITATLTESKAPPFFSIALSSVPARELNEIISLLWFDKAYADLPADQVAEIESIEAQHFPDPK
jgi:hypothetical protein